MLLAVVLVERIARVEVRAALLALEISVVCHANLLMVGADDAAPTGRGHSPSIGGECRRRCAAKRSLDALYRSTMIRYFDVDQNRSASGISSAPRNVFPSRVATLASSRLCRDTI